VKLYGGGGAVSGSVVGASGVVDDCEHRGHSLNGLAG